MPMSRCGSWRDYSALSCSRSVVAPAIPIQQHPAQAKNHEWSLTRRQSEAICIVKAKLPPAQTSDTLMQPSVPPSPDSALKFSRYPQLDPTYPQEFQRFEYIYSRRKTRFQSLQERQDVSNERLFVLSDQKPWQVFGGSTSTKVQRRRLVFEHTGSFPVLHEACYTGDSNNVRTLLETPGVCVLSRDECGRIVLHHAVINEQFKTAKRLLRRRDGKLQAHCQDNSHRTALHYVLEKMENLARHGDYCGGRRRLPALRTVEMRAMSKRYRRLWKMADQMLRLLNQEVLHKEQVDEGYDSVKVLDMRCRGDMWDVCRSGDLTRLETIVQVYGCCSEDWELGELKWTLLHEACEYGQLGVAHFLISTREMSMLAQDTSGCTPLHCAARRGCLDVCQLLLGKMTSTYVEESEDDGERANELVLCQDTCGRTALHWSLLSSCSSHSRSAVAAVLGMSCASALHIGDKDGVTPLHLAIWRGDVELIQQFITIGANVCAPSFSATDTKHKENREKEKAPWAPCALVFQRQRFSTSSVKPDISSMVAPSNGESQVISRKDVRHLECAQHPVEALWYWAQRSSAHRAVSEEKVALIKDDKQQDDETVIADEVLGCLKYGGWCSNCKPTTTGTIKSSRKILHQYGCVLPPLLLALRVCALKGRFGSMVSHRISVIELLLMSGAHPDGADGDDDGTCSVAERGYPRDLSTLGEGLRASLRCPQILPMLLLHGAERVNIDGIIRCCSLAFPSDMGRIESALCQLIDLDTVASDCKLLVMLFDRKYFRALGEFVKSLSSLKPKTFTSAEVADNDGENGLLTGSSPWKSIQESLLSRRKQRIKTCEVRQIDSEHLRFLCGSAQSGEGRQGGRAGLHDEDKLQLLDYCLDQYFQCQATFSTLNRRQGAVRRPSDESEHVVLCCIRVLFAHWKSCASNSEKIMAKAVDWLGSAILCGFFECTIALLETQRRSHQNYALLDTVFEHHTKAVAARGYHESDQPCHRRAFLIACAENLLNVNQSTSFREQELMDLSPSCEVVSVRTIVHTCAYNLPFDVIKHCFDLVLPNGFTSNGIDTFTTLKAMQVRGKTMVQWLVIYLRSDVMQLLLMRIPAGLERSAWWGELVGAPSCRFYDDNEKEFEKAHTSFVDRLFSMYVDNVEPHLSSTECDELLLGLMIACAIPKDCVSLMARLLDCWRSGDSTSNELIEKGQVRVALMKVGILHAITRWNAVRIAECCLSRDNARIDWHQVFAEQAQDRHALDTCRPLELCHLLGHNHLYSLLSDCSNISSRTDEHSNAKELDEVEPPEKTEEEGRISTQQFGLLRTVLRINGNEMTKQHCKSKIVSSRLCSTSFQNRWEAAVALNQVSHLQAMALTKQQAAETGVTVHHLILTAIKHGSFNALRWILEANSPVGKSLSESEGIECLYTAAKHPADVYAEMTGLLLESGLSPGRLSGDGMAIPLLHRAACFSNVSLACCIMTKLLERSDCDVNALDAFGNTAITYALAAGRLQNACFLIQRLTCRLEAEYEGQSCFYYVLHIIPSFAWRTIIRELLIVKRSRAFLHCDADNKTCGCKSFENPRDGDYYCSSEVSSRPCEFCGHEFMCHRIVPLPSWYRDQYDTYVAETPPRKRSRSSSVDQDDESDDELSRNGLPDEDSLEDEETVLENTRGRLNVELLERITVIRYDDIAQANGLVVSAACDRTVNATAIISEPIEQMGDNVLGGKNCRSSMNDITEMEATASEILVESTMELLPPTTTAEDCTQEIDPIDIISDECASTRAICKEFKTSRKLSDYPSYLRPALGMVHSPQCVCQTPDFITSQAQLAYIVICRWIRNVAKANVKQHQTQDLNCSPRSRLSTRESAIVVLASVEPAFQHWRQVMQSSETIAVSVDRKPVASGVLKSVLSQWRYAKEFSAFQRWKNYRYSAEVTHHRLATRLDQLEADMRHNRFLTLQVRQQQLRDATRSLMV